MRPRARVLPSPALQAQVLARVEAGYTVKALASLPGYPSPATLRGWKARDPDFARRLAEARVWGRGVRAQAVLSIRTYDEARAQDFLLRVRRGERIAALLRTPGQPNRAALDAWKRQRPDFAAALAQAVDFSRRLRPRRFARYDEAIADRIILRLFHGERLRDLMAEPGLPGRTAIRRWRRQEPAFEGALKMAVRSGIRRMGGFRPDRPTRCTPQITEAVATHILEGGSLRSAAGLPGMPHYSTLCAWRTGRPSSVPRPGPRVRPRAVPDSIRTFARDITFAEQLRDDVLADQALLIAQAATPQTLAAARKTLAAARQRLGQLTDHRRSR